MEDWADQNMADKQDGGKLKQQLERDCLSVGAMALELGRQDRAESCLCSVLRQGKPGSFSLNSALRNLANGIL